jgi:exo-beta-1,3-glucanase (GH17 family)/cellulose synthase/poly-beta-1,6-N-acetylglucosamine synthase-like glycosyltransferase
MLRLTNWVIGIAVAIISLSLWAYINRPHSLPDWPNRVMGFSFSPYHMDQDPREKLYPAVEQIEADLTLLSGKAIAVRTYSVEDNLAEVPRLARQHNLNVALGAYLSYDDERNSWEFPRFLEIAKNNPNVVRAFVGNETQHTRTLDYEKLLDFLDQARATLRVPVSTAEPAHIWHNHPDLVEHVDFIAVQILPYWEGKEVTAAVDYVFNELRGLKETYPGKPIIISEVGWPSHGRVKRDAVASRSNQATFLRLFLARVPKEGYIYYIMEAFDQPWKTDIEGAVGAYWGVYDVERQPKFEFTQPIVPVPQWQLLAAISIVLAIITFGLLLIDSRTMRGHGRSFLAVVSYLAATSIVWIIYQYTTLYLTLGHLIIGILLVIGMIGILLVLLAEAHEWAEALWLGERRRYMQLTPLPNEQLPMISVHLPAYNEPPEMMIRTLDALAALNYPDYEIVVIDNNTKDPAVWQPVKEHCERLGPRFRFFHVEPLAGFKAGALNYALRHTDPRAGIVAVIDSDYIVHPYWLRDLAPQFSEAKVAIVQAPQDYSDGNDNAFKAMCYSEYAGFFYIGMMTRNERNAIIQHGTMTMVRRTVLEEVGGWAEWCITEDAELGLRIFEQGYEAHYIPRSYGRGVMPDTFIDYKKQRFRWAYGAVQILRHHTEGLFSIKGSRLTLGQRYHFIAGWLPWLADGFNLLFNMAALSWSLAMVLAPTTIDPPMLVFSLLPLSLFLFKGVKLFYIYKTRIGASTLQTLAGGLAGLALAHTISRAILLGFVTSGVPFFRTPKLAKRLTWRSAFAMVREESVLLAGLWLAAAALVATVGVEEPDMLLWVIVLLVQSLSYLASVVIAMVSTLPNLSARGLSVRPIEQSEPKNWGTPFR